MKYILINPVTDRMFAPEQLERLLEEAGFRRVYCETDWAVVVKEKYQRLLERQQGTVVDMRCPLAWKLVSAIKQTEATDLVFPDIEPILIHCAREISERTDLRGSEKIITTPCRALAQMGNRLGLPETRFEAWNDFAAERSEARGSSRHVGKASPAMTPIPLGFFQKLPVKQKSVSGETAIRELFQSEDWKGLQLAELLYCEDGCHNGDGVHREQEKPEKGRWGRLIKPAALITAVLVVWYFVTMTGVVSTYILPSPQKVLESFGAMILSGEMFQDIAISFMRVLRGFIIAFALAFLFGMITFLKPKWSQYYEFLIQFFRNVPPLSLIPLLILWYGIGETTKTVIIVLASFFPIYLNIVKGFTGCDPKLLEVGRAFGYTQFEKFARITLPYALSDILVGMRIGLGYSWRAIIAAEMIAASTGLGHMILFAQQMSRTDKVIVGIIAIGLVGYLCDRVFAWAIKKTLKGATENGWN